MKQKESVVSRDIKFQRDTAGRESTPAREIYILKRWFRLGETNGRDEQRISSKAGRSFSTCNGGCHLVTCQSSVKRSILRFQNFPLLVSITSPGSTNVFWTIDVASTVASCRLRVDGCSPSIPPGKIAPPLTIVRSTEAMKC